MTYKYRQELYSSIRFTWQTSYCIAVLAMILLFVAQVNAAPEPIIYDYSSQEYSNDDFSWIIASDGTAVITYCNNEDATSIEIPEKLNGYNVSRIGYLEEYEEGSYEFCQPIPTEVQTISVESDSQYFTAQNGVLYSKDKTEIYRYPAGNSTTSFSIPAGVKLIFHKSFNNSSKLTSVTIPSDVTEIGLQAFEDCKKLTSIALPDSLVTIGEEAFEDCERLQTISIPKNVTNIGTGAFEGCEGLSTITVVSGNTRYKSVDGVLFDYAMKTLIAYPANHGVSTYTVPAGVEVIAHDAFEDAVVNQVVLPNTLKRIESYAFNSSELSSINIPNGVTYIGEYAFEECYNLERSGVTFEGEIPAGAEDAFPFTIAPEGQPNELTGLKIIGDNKTYMGLDSSYTAIASYANGASKVVTPDWNILRGSQYANISENGVLSIASLPEPFTFEIQAEYSENGIARADVIEVSATLPFYEDANLEYTYILNPGWQFISIVLNLTEESKQKLLSLPLFSYNADTKCYCKPLDLTAGMACWVFASQKTTIKVTGTPSGILLSSNRKDTYLVVDLATGSHHYTNTAPDISDDTCRTTELWLRKIPAGNFTMGSPAEEFGREEDYERQHIVNISQDFYMGVFEVTQKQYSLIYGSNPSIYKGDTLPVENVTYDAIRGNTSTLGGGWPDYGHAVDITAFLGKLRSQTGLTFDLPTEAQWEYACRAGSVTALNSGENLMSETSDFFMDDVGRYTYNQQDGKGGYSQHTKVGSYLPNVWGIYDMHGNVREWCLDWFQVELDTSYVLDPVGATSGNTHVLRGGSWNETARACRSAFRNSFGLPYLSLNYYGFRLVVLP